MKGMVDLFANKAPGNTKPKAINTTEIPMATNYAREVYLLVSLLLRCNLSVCGNITEDMGKTTPWGGKVIPKPLQK